ncbi:hypothetical protein Lesp02_08530 [Lentzea sp. NBRC 105346]|uniref:DUF5753 domain-containing protein n=1 Tax=Lentzea sp. NBRC 105346 TaxID=3032205 RepID=UPI0024A50B2E|nr:DUF5753 domain-containing protein [Lentzea sp. NBRC 105346]GLZ28663.1 hypothetical protein Lesp02_08530 [Lentzea sp. NBRC 105346]
MSTVCGREFGDGVRTELQNAGFSYRQACELLDWDHAKLSDMCNGKGGVSEVEVAMVLGLCRTAPDTRDRLLGLFQESREVGLLQLYESVVPEQVQTLIKHEKLATASAAWNMNIIPGLLQVPRYVDAIVRSSVAVPSANVDELIAARIARREILRGQCHFTFYIHEQALHLPVGGYDVLSEQLHDLLQMLVRPYINVRIVPTVIGAHPATSGDFRMMTFEKFTPVVYLESLNSELFLDDKASIDLYEKVLEALDQIALSVEESREVIISIVT